MELCSGALLFTAVFFMNYPNVRFRSVNFAMLYGMAGGVVYMLIRYFGAIGIIGPCRMDYAKVMPIVSALAESVGAVLSDERQMLEGPKNKE